MENKELDNLKRQYQNWRINKHKLASGKIPEKLRRATAILAIEIGKGRVAIALNISGARISEWINIYASTKLVPSNIDFVKLKPISDEIRAPISSTLQTNNLHSNILIGEITSKSGYELKLYASKENVALLISAFIEADKSLN